LDLHAPYLPSSLEQDQNYLASLKAFMARCYAGNCDFKRPEESALLERAKQAYLAGQADVEKRIEDVLTIVRHSKRPFRLIITADHGELFGEHNGVAHSGAFVQELLAVPFVVYDSTESARTSECRLLSTSEALGEAFGLSRPIKARSRLELDGAPLGTAVIDVEKNVIEYSIADAMLAHRGTWRNVHPNQKGTVPFATARCNAEAGR